MREVEKKLPHYSYVYLGDNARTPYGGHSHETIYKFTRQGIKKLFDEGARLVIVACNTASSVALRRIQQELLPEKFPDRRVLGIIIPTAEEIVLHTTTREIGILATEATVHSFTYPKEITKIYPGIKVYQQACPLLVPIIEAGELKWEGLSLAVKKYSDALLSLGSSMDTVVLGCTHYALIEDLFRKQLPSGINIVSQGTIIADKLSDYLFRHPEIEITLNRKEKRIFFSTEDSWRVRNLFELFYGKKVDIKKVAL